MEPDHSQKYGGAIHSGFTLLADTQRCGSSCRCTPPQTRNGPGYYDILTYSQIFPAFLVQKWRCAARQLGCQVCFKQVLYPGSLASLYQFILIIDHGMPVRHANVAFVSSCEALVALLGSSSLHRLGLAGNALGTDGAVRLILAAALGREMDLGGEGLNVWSSASAILGTFTHHTPGMSHT